MNGDIDKWLNEGVAEALAAARAATNGQPPAPATPSSPSPAAGSPSKSLSTRGIGRGGVIRNKSTKILTQGENPVTNPRPSREQRVPGAKSVPESDPQAEFKAAHPALAVPSIFTGMDIDVNKKAPAPAPVQEQIFSSVAPPIAAAAPADPVVSFDTTVRQLLELAQQDPKRMVHVTTSRFVLSLEIFKNSQSIALELPGAAPKTQ